MALLLSKCCGMPNIFREVHLLQKETDKFSHDITIAIKK
jgi:hypothetical protein